MDERQICKIILKRMMKISGAKTQDVFAEKILGIKGPSISGAMARGKIPDTWFDYFEKKYGITREDFIHEAVNHTIDTIYVPPPGSGNMKPLASIPVLGRVPAGVPNSFRDEVVDYITIPGCDSECYALKVVGDSMKPTFDHGDYVLFVIDLDIRPNDIVIVNDEYGESMVKRYKTKNNEHFLTSDNPAYPTYQPDENYRIVGKVINAIRILGVR